MPCVLSLRSLCTEVQCNHRQCQHLQHQAGQEGRGDHAAHPATAPLLPRLE